MNKIKIAGVLTLMVIGFVALSMVIGYLSGLLLTNGLAGIAAHGGIVYIGTMLLGLSLEFSTPLIGYCFGKHVFAEVVEVLIKD